MADTSVNDSSAPRKSPSRLLPIALLFCIAAVGYVIAKAVFEPQASPTQVAPARVASTQPASARHITADTFANTVKSGVVLIDFWAEWCGPCRQQGPIVDTLAGKFSGRATVGKIDVDSEEELAGRFGIRSIPTLVVLKNGKEVKRFVGVTQEKALAAAIESAL